MGLIQTYKSKKLRNEAAKLTLLCLCIETIKITYCCEAALELWHSVMGNGKKKEV